MPETDFDPIRAAEAALESGARSRELVQRFGVHVVRDRRLAEFDVLLGEFDQWTGRGELLNWLTDAVDRGALVWAESDDD